MSASSQVPQSGTSTWAIRNPIPVVVFFLVMSILGVFAFKSLRVNNFPDIDLPVVSVTYVQSGAAPAELENQVTRIVENSVAGIGSVKHVNSIINDGVSTTVIEFQLGVDLEKATNDVRNAVAEIRSNLPADVQDPIVQREEVSGDALINYIIHAEGMNPEQLSWFVDNDITKKIMSKKGVARVSREGGVEREIRIELDAAKLAALGVTASDISSQLRRENINLPGGRMEVGDQEQSIRTIGNAASVERLSQTRINLSNGSTVVLQDLGKVIDTWGEPRQRARFNGQEVVGFGVFRGIGSSEVDVAITVRQSIEEIKKAYPNVTIEEVTTSVDDVNESFAASMETLALGALLAVLVVWLFLRDVRATFITAMAMPMSLLPTFFVMQMMNQSFNVVTLLALSLTIGILVDDAIVEIENIVRHIRNGKSPYKAALEAADEIGLAVVATTATLIAVFAPVGFMPGIVGQFFKCFAIAACVSVFFSLIVARTLTPLMGGYLLRNNSKKEHGEPFWMAPYLKILHWGLDGRIRFLNTRWVLGSLGALILGLTIMMVFGMITGATQAKPINYVMIAIVVAIGGLLSLLCFAKVSKLPNEPLHMRWFVLALGIGFFIFSNFVASKLPGEFIPVGDTTHSYMSINMAPGTRLDETDAVVKGLMAELKKRPEVMSSYASIGLKRASITINLVKRDQRKLNQQEFEAEFGKVASQYPGVRINFGGGGGGGGGTQFTLVSDTPDELARVSKDLERQMRGLSSIKNVSSSDNLTRPEVIVKPIPDQAALMGVTALQISQTARVASVGDFDQSLAKYNLGDRQIPIRVLLNTGQRTDIANLSSLMVPTKFGTSVPLSAVADIELGSGPVVINRIDRSRSVTIRADLNGVASGIVQEQVKALPAYKSMPSSVRELATGDTENQAELAKGFGLAIGTGILLMYVVLVLLFKSFTHPITILSALPLSFGGAFFLLLVTNKALSMPALIGLIMLTGIAAKNSILLVEYALVAINQGVSRRDALMDAAHKRARPIIMTTVAMGAGMVPIAAGWGADVAFRSPMATAVIGGLLTSTVLSLLFVPVFYTFIDDISQLFARHTKRYFTAQGKADLDEEERAEKQNPAE